MPATRPALIAAIDAAIERDDTSEESWDAFLRDARALAPADPDLVAFLIEDAGARDAR